MAKKTDRKMIVGLDIGTSKVVAIVGELTANGEVEIVGLGSSRSRGLKKGVVVNIESTVHSIQRAIEEAELMAGCNIHSVFYRYCRQSHPQPEFKWDRGYTGQ